jgi:hypothetical protein
MATERYGKNSLKKKGLKIVDATMAQENSTESFQMRTNRCLKKVLLLYTET